MSQFPSQGEKENPLKTAPIKDTVADSDGVVLVDGQDTGTKRVLWSTIKSALGQVFAPLTRKINDKPLTSDVVLTGDDIATSATDGTTVSSSLSNKLGISGSLPADTDLNELFAAGFYYTTMVTTPTILHAPFDTTFNLYVIRSDTSESAKRTLQLATSLSSNDNTMKYRKYTNGTWSEWTPFAHATPPQEFNLPLADGISGTAKYSKDQFGIVRLYMAVVKDAGTITNNEILGTLPEGFRPKTSFAVVGYGNSNSNSISDRHPVNMYISSNGDITASFLAETDAAKLASLYGVTEFIAAS